MLRRICKMTPNDSAQLNGNNPSKASSASQSALALARAISGDTLIGVPGQTVRKPHPNPKPAAEPKEVAQSSIAQPGSTSTPFMQPPLRPFSVLRPTEENTGTASAAPIPNTSGTTPPMSADGPAVVYKRPTKGSSELFISSMTRLVKLGIAGAIIFGICYFTTRSVIPVLKELNNPTPITAESAPAQDGPAFVRAIQQTRAVVAKNDTNVSHLDAILADPTGAGKTAPPSTELQLDLAPEMASDVAVLNQQPIVDSAPQVDPYAGVSVSVYSPGRAVEVSMTRSPTSTLSKETIQVLAQKVTTLDINGIRNSANPRFVMGGILIKVGDMVDYELGITFTGIDYDKRILMFQTSEGDLLARTF